MKLEGVLYACGRTAAAGRLVQMPGGFRFEPVAAGQCRYAAFPGLVNAHDHLHLNVFPRTRFRDRYSHAVDWVRDMAVNLDSGRFDELRRVPAEARAWHGAAKNALSGAVLVAHHDPRMAVFDDPDFPVTVAGPHGWAHSVPLGDPRWHDGQGDLPRYGPAPADSVAATPAGQPWFAHVAEGTDARARGELALVAAAGGLSTQTRLVHGVGLDAEGVAAARTAGAALIWCPSANEFLLGAQPDPAAFASGSLALGTDARLTGSRDILAELQIAHGHALVTPLDLMDAVTSAGRRLVGAPAADAACLVDLAVLELPAGSPQARNGGAASVSAPPSDLADYTARRLVSATRSDLALVLARGRPVLSSLEFAECFSDLGEPALAVRLDGVPRLVAERVATRWNHAGLTEPGLEFERT